MTKTMTNCDDKYDDKDKLPNMMAVEYCQPIIAYLHWPAPKNLAKIRNYFDFTVKLSGCGLWVRYALVGTIPSISRLSQTAENVARMGGIIRCKYFNDDNISLSSFTHLRNN